MDYYQEILNQIQKDAKPYEGKFTLDRYLGTSHKLYGFTTAEVVAIAKRFINQHPDLTVEQLVEVISRLRQGDFFVEYAIAGKLLESLPNLRTQIDPKWIDPWMDQAQGWAEVDVVCQSPFGAKEVLDNWSKWEKLLKQLVKDSNIHKRRASLVLLTKPVRLSDDKRLSDLAFENIEKLKLEKDVLITKAISWILRSLIKNHRGEVEDYLKANQDVLPKIALRETQRKLLTGKK